MTMSDLTLTLPGLTEAKPEFESNRLQITLEAVFLLIPYEVKPNRLSKGGPWGFCNSPPLPSPPSCSVRRLTPFQLFHLPKLDLSALLVIRVYHVGH